jgi:pyroglutamyl-peptidase
MYDHIYLTGFKKFGTHEVNPTEEVVNAIHIEGVTCNIVEVTTVDVDGYIHRISHELAERKGQSVLHLHFGVGPNSVYKPESYAYNNKTFSIPDNLGYQPQDEPINDKYYKDAHLATTVDIEWLFKEATWNGFAWEHSTDPGRYLCNYIYFRSLSKFSKY